MVIASAIKFNNKKYNFETTFGYSDGSTKENCQEVYFDTIDGNSKGKNNDR